MKRQQEKMQINSLELKPSFSVDSSFEADRRRAAFDSYNFCGLVRWIINIALLSKLGIINMVHISGSSSTAQS